jgi:hypothetical protein
MHTGLLIETRAAQKANAGLLDPNGFVLLGADDIRDFEQMLGGQRASRSSLVTTRVSPSWMNLSAVSSCERLRTRYLFTEDIFASRT